MILHTNLVKKSYQEMLPGDLTQNLQRCHSRDLRGCLQIVKRELVEGSLGDPCQRSYQDILSFCKALAKILSRPYKNIG